MISTIVTYGVIAMITVFVLTVWAVVRSEME